MTISNVANLVDVLRQADLLTPAQLDEIGSDLKRFADARALAQDLIQRNWLTAFQVNHIFQGHAQSLAMGPYVLLERIGEGGVGQVYKARHKHMQRLVAIKVIRKDLISDQEIIGRFYREIHAISQLIHPNIILAFDAGPTGRTHFFVMEYVEGLDFGKLIKKAGRLPVEQACDYIRQAALGLDHIHERGLVHRDIKPTNLLVTGLATPGEPTAAPVPAATGTKPPAFPWGLVKLLDLGLARLGDPINGAAPGSPLTMAGGALRGTADYLSPEQAIDFHKADIRSDIYSLGCTFYFLLSGQPPFEGGTLAQKLMKHQREEPKKIEELRPEVPHKVAEILRQMLAKRPKERFQTPGEIAEALVAAKRRRSWLNLWRK
jgi:serine/threonine protein kinase